MQFLYVSVALFSVYKSTPDCSCVCSALSAGAAEQTGSSSSSSRPPSLPYSHQVSPMSPRPQEGLQHRPTVLHNTSSKNLQSSEHSSPSVLRSDRWIYHSTSRSLAQPSYICLFIYCHN